MNIFDRKIFRYLILRIVKAALMQLFSVYELKRRGERKRLGEYGMTVKC